MPPEFKEKQYVLCNGGQGHCVRDGSPEKFVTNFPSGSVCQVKKVTGDFLVVDVLGLDADFIVPAAECATVDVFKTGKGKSDHKICNLCFVLKRETEFELNQTDAGGNKTRRPSCKTCRQDHIDKKPMTAKEKKLANKERPPDGSMFRCPICKKRGIVGVNVLVRLDHRHTTGKRRAFLCDSCNTGLGRFKNGENLLQNAIDYVAEFEKSNT